MQIRLSVLAMAAGVMGSGMARGAEAQKGPKPVEIKAEVGTKASLISISGPPPFQPPSGK